MFRRVGIIAKEADATVREVLASTIEVLLGADCDVAIDANCASVCRADGIECAADDDLATGRDLLIAIGGDGTLLRAAQLVFPKNVPLMGINLGRLGFLTDLNPEHVAEGLTEILNGKYSIEDRFVLNCKLTRAGKVVAEGHGLNDVVVQKWNSARLITLHTYVDGHFVHSQRSDGLIISTPTGSTAYALSGGGPILHPSLNAMSLIPICPHSLTNRPIVIEDSARVEVEIGSENPGDCQVTCDGNLLSEAGPGDRIQITKHHQSVKLVHPAGHDHFATLRAKLHWGRELC
jgi:NAD+ kinase